MNDKIKNKEHPLEQFKFCPKCGSEHFVINNGKSRHCEDCGFTYYANPSASTAAFIVNDGDELLVCLRGKEPAKGTLDLPGGFCDMNETAEQGVCREVMEETGLRVEKLKYLFSLPNIYVYSGYPVHTMDLFFRCSVDQTAHIEAMDDVADSRFIPLDEVNPEDFGLTSIRRAVQIFLSTYPKKTK